MTHRAVIGFAAFVCGLCCFLATPAPAASIQLKLTNGETVDGEPVSFNAQGVVIKKEDGSFAPRVPWTNLSQATLKELNSVKAAKPFVEGLIEPEDVDPTGKEKAIELNVKIPDRLERPDPKAGLGGITSSSITLIWVILLYVGNVYAGYEAGVFRNYHWAITCPVAAILPVIGPIITLCLPTRIKKSQDELAAESMAAHLAAQQAQEAAEAAENQPNPEELAAQQAAAEVAAAEAAKPKIVTFARGQTTFNRRFFETKFAGFLRMVPGEAEQDKMLYIKSARGEHVGARLSRIDPNEIYLQIRDGTATADVKIPFNEIYEIQIRPVGA